jgi:DNA-binding beta-propeller fold protein YncE
MVLSLRQHIDISPYSESKFDHADVHRSSGLVFIAHTANGSIEIINGEKCFHISNIPGCPEASGVLCAQEDNLIFAAARGAGKILVIDPISQVLIREITSIGSKPNGLAWDTRRRHLLVTDVQDFKARLIDTSSGYTLSTAELPGRPRWCVYDYNRDRFLINIRDPPSVFMLASVKETDGSGVEESILQSVGSIPVSSIGPHGLDIDNESDQAFVACDSGEVVVLDLKKENTIRSTASIPIAGEPDVVWYNTNKHRLYCAVGNPGVIDVIDTNKMTLVEEIHIEEGVHTFAFDNIRQQLYAFLPHSCRVAVYNET